MYSDYIVPVCIQNDLSILTEMDSVATVTGWGKALFGGATSTQLKETYISILNDTDCLRKHPKIANISTRICGEVTRGGNKETCQVNKIRLNALD